MQKINFRMFVFTALILLIIGAPTFVYLGAATDGGISRRGDLFEVDLKAMSSFEMDQINGVTADIPQRFRALDGKRVLMCGEMVAPRSAAARVNEFDLVYSISQCCIGPGPKVQHFVRSATKRGRSVEYRSGFVNVVGILHVSVETAEGHVQSVYRVDVESVDPL